MERRSFVPPTLTDNAEAARRFWSLDRTMLSAGQGARSRWVLIDEASYSPFIETHIFKVGDTVPLFGSNGVITEYGVVTQVFPSTYALKGN